MLSEGPTPEEERNIDAHFEHLQRLVLEGTVLMAGRTLTAGPETFGIVMISAQNDSHAADIMNSDPVVRSGVMLAECFPFKVALNGWTV
jgi:uncharacterized protein YciI